MNDGIQKMAEATAGRPFEIGVFVNGAAGYTVAKPASSTSACKTREDDKAWISQDLANWECDTYCPPECESSIRAAALTLDRLACVESAFFTVKISEIKDGRSDRRGLYV